MTEKERAAFAHHDDIAGTIAGEVLYPRELVMGRGGPVGFETTAPMVGIPTGTALRVTERANGSLLVQYADEDGAVLSARVLAASFHKLSRERGY